MSKDIINAGDLDPEESYSPDQRVRLWLPIYGEGKESHCIEMVTTIGCLASHNSWICDGGEECESGLGYDA